MTPVEWDYARELRVHGYRLTPQRQLIIDTLRRLDGHVAASTLYEAVHALSPALDRATVYRTLHLFVELGVVVSAEINNQTVYEIAHPNPHHHLVCTACGDVQVLSDNHFDHLATHLLAEHGFAADLAHLTIAGRCHKCRTALSQTI